MRVFKSVFKNQEKNRECEKGTHGVQVQSFFRNRGIRCCPMKMDIITFSTTATSTSPRSTTGPPITLVTQKPFSHLHNAFTEEASFNERFTSKHFGQKLFKTDALLGAHKICFESLVHVSGLVTKRNIFFQCKL